MNIKKIGTLLIGLLSLSSYSFGLTEQDKLINKCLEQLHEQVKKQYNIDISRISVNSKSANLSVYKYDEDSTETVLPMFEVLKENPDTFGCESTYGISSEECKNNFSNIFFAKRNNISTVMVTPEKKGEGYWTATEFVTWGGNIGFQFPLQKRDDPQFVKYNYYNEGDDYGQLEKNVVYIQYLTDGSLLSCGFINFQAGNGHTLNDLFQSNYLGNAFEKGGFEKLFKTDEFYGMKVRVIGLDYAESILFNLNLIGIAYNNKNELFNEYISYPLQIKSMTDISKQDGEKSMYDVMEKYRSYLIDNTCFKLIHTKSNLPSFCNGNFTSESDLVSYIIKKEKFVTSIKNFFIPKVYAFEVPDNLKKVVKEKELPLPTTNGVDIYTMKKINNLEDKNLKGMLILVLSPGYDAVLQKRKERGEQLSYDELVYLKCPLNHDQIVENVNYLFQHYYKDGKLDLSNPKYLNPEFGNCIIPYPDVRYKDKYVENSFLQNKLTYIKNKFGEKKMEEFESKIHKIKVKYDKQLEQLKQEYVKAMFEKNEKKKQEIEEKIKKVYENIDKEIKELESKDPEFKKYIEEKQKTLKKVPQKEINEKINKKTKKEEKNYLWYILGGLAIVMIAIVLIANKNKDDKKN